MNKYFWKEYLKEDSYVRKEYKKDLIEANLTSLCNDMFRYIFFYQPQLEWVMQSDLNLESSNRSFIDLMMIRKIGYDYSSKYGSFGESFNNIIDEAIEKLYDPVTKDFIYCDEWWDKWEESREILGIYHQYKCKLSKSINEYLVKKHNLQEQN